MSMTMTHPSVPRSRTMERNLVNLAARLSEAGLLVSTEGSLDRMMDHLAFDSRAVAPGGLFVAMRGTTTDGHLFIDKAVENGATAIAVEATSSGTISGDVARLRVTDGRRALAVLASSWWNDPADDLRMVGVTGTNGKTTTAWLVMQALETTGHPCGMIGTIGAGRPGSLAPIPNTTPDALALNEILSRFRTARLECAAMEVSSHALAQDRVYGLAFEVAVFTNLTRDHLDYHPDLEAYASTKARLFDDLPRTGVAVVNQDDPASARMIRDCRARRLTYGTGPDSDIAYRIEADGADGLRIRLDGMDRRFVMAGTFNAANIAAAYATLRALGVEAVAAGEALGMAKPAPGRFELAPLPDARTAVIDYAHTPDALAGVLRASRPLVAPGGRLWCVFGCGGDRDTGKRSEMGAVAESLADCLILTSDNPRTEDPERIIDDILSGIRRPDVVHRETVRRAALRLAARETGPGDVIVVAGKGHETYQVIGRENTPFDDRVEVRAAFAKADGGG